MKVLKSKKIYLKKRIQIRLRNYAKIVQITVGVFLSLHNTNGTRIFRRRPPVRN